MNMSPLFSMSYVPLDVIPSWKRISLAADFCSNLVLEGTDERVHNALSTIVNELIELSIKYGIHKNMPYQIEISKNSDLNNIGLRFYLQSVQLRRLRCHVKKIRKMGDNDTLSDTFFSGNHSELSYALLTLFREYKGDIEIMEKKGCEMGSVHIMIRFSDKECHYDY